MHVSSLWQSMGKSLSHQHLNFDQIVVYLSNDKIALSIEKLSAKTPDKETKMKILTAIAKEHDVKWDSKAFDEELQKPKEDLLNGSSSFGGATKMSMEPLNINFPPKVNQVAAESAEREHFQTCW
ncbi:uncharacterized protein LOC110112068 isoform X2 [Dendrobium catenatum]|uniref:uncharacterized protein LOC110112068 isoform X2 n=1 Tax=Dendrobium catenatum TaxID=906689 RepID=UPI0009F73E4E|nr:uncharacterized protein LOC110112068 isoform X2 [Dendrobium catenatum]